jgi:hypothetical protein
MMSATLSIKNNQVIHTTAAGVESAAVSMQTQSGSVYSLQETAVTPRLKPVDVKQKPDGGVVFSGFLFGHAQHEDGAYADRTSRVATLTFPNFVLDAPALQVLTVISPLNAAQAKFEPQIPVSGRGHAAPPAPGGVN